MVSVHQVLPCPLNCPSHLYSIMVDCWNAMPSLRPSFTTVHRRLCQWTEELASVPNSVNQSFTYSLTQCPPYTLQATNQVTASELFPCKHKVNAMTSASVQLPATGVHPAILNSAETASRPSVISPGVPYSVNCFNVGLHSPAMTVPSLQNSHYVAPGPQTVNFFRHQPDTSAVDVNSLNASTLQSSSLAASQRKVSSRTSNNSSISSASDCKSPRWPSVNHSPRDAISYEELKTRLNDVVTDDTLPLHESQTPRL